jgi:hypothetical protein
MHHGMLNAYTSKRGSVVEELQLESLSIDK